MKENNDLKIKYHSNNKNEKLEQTNSNKYIKYSSNIIRNINYYKTYINKKNISNQIREKEGIKKELNSINVKSISKNINSNLIKSYSNKKDQYKAIEKIDNYNINQNLSGYKKILDKMVEKFAINENSKETINNLLKKSITNQKYLMIKKSNIFSPSLKKHFWNNNNNITKIKYKFFSGDNRSIRKKNESYINKLVKLQAFWRGYYLRNIVVRGLKKYYGLIFIYKLLKKYFLKKNRNIFEILFGNNKLKNNERTSTKFKSLNSKFIYSKKLFYNNTLNNSDKNSFSFSTPKDGTIENFSEQKIKTFYSIDKDNKNFKKKFNFTELKNNSKTINNALSNSVKEINLNQNNINININNDNKNNFLINNYYATSNLSSNIFKGENNSKIGKITYNFFNKYEDKDIKPIDSNSQYLFRKPIYKKQQNKKYIYVNKNINKDKNFYLHKKYSYNSKYDCNNNINSGNKLKFNCTLYNIYKFVFFKTINFIKNKIYNTYFLNFIYQLKIKKSWRIKKIFRYL